MKKFLFLLAVLFAQQVSAQYFVSTYGGATSYEANAQFVSCSTPQPLPPPALNAPGYILVGRHLGTTNMNLHLVHSDNLGAVPPLTAPFFNKYVVLSDPTTHKVYDAWATSIAEMPGVVPGTFDYVVTGTVVIDPLLPDFDFFVLRMTDNGVILWVNRYDFPHYTFDEPKLKMDITQTNILVTGTCSDINNPVKMRDVFAFSINAGAGAINWGKAYDIITPNPQMSRNDRGRDIIENPYSPAAAREILIVGATNNEALLLRIASATGTPLPVTPVLTYNIPGAQAQILNCINNSGNVSPGNNFPFIVAGNVLRNAPVQNDGWAMLIDQFGNITWSTPWDSGIPGGPYDNTCNEIMERRKPNPPFGVTYEYYTAGTIFNPNAVQPGNTDIQCMKLNVGGLVVIPFGEFIYGTPIDMEEGMDIHHKIPFGGLGSGIAVSGNTSLLAGEQFRVNAYYNGKTACDTAFYTYDSRHNQVDTISYLWMTDSIPQSNPLDTLSDTLTTTLICSAAAVAGGSNAKIVPVAPQPAPDEGLNFTVLGSEQGVSTGSNLHIAVQNNANGKLTARIIDLLGREYACKLTDEGNGRFGISSNLPSAGTYYIILSNGKETKAKALFVK